LDDLRDKAKDFLSRYHPSGSIPVPIDDIVELELRISVIPVEGLSHALGEPGLISRDLLTIRIDQNVLEKKPFLYRTTIAHEAAHAILHRDIFSRFSYSNEEGWIRLVQSIDEKAFRHLEWQAGALASLICVPRQALKREVGIAIQKATTASAGLHETGSPLMLQYVSQYLSRVFEVQPSMVRQRIEDEGFLPPSAPSMQSKA